MKKFILLLLITIIASGCGRKSSVMYDFPEQLDESAYEMVWVNPSIVESDTLFSLIKAERLDSIFVENSVAPDFGRTALLTFEIPMGSCQTTIEFTDPAGESIYRIFSGELSLGHYKLSLNSENIELSEISKDDLYVRVNYCARSIINKLIP